MEKNNNQETFFFFQDLDGGIIQIEKGILEKYPASFLNRLALSGIGKPSQEGTFLVPCHGSTLDMIAEFYYEECWRNPYEVGNQMVIDQVDGGFEAICDYLGLPSVPFASPEDTEQSYYGLYDDELGYEEFKYLKEAQDEEQAYLDSLIVDHDYQDGERRNKRIC